MPEPTPTAQGRRPRPSLAFCAYNEEAVLPAKIENLRRLRDAEPDLEILAYSDASSDRTVALLQAEADRMGYPVLIAEDMPDIGSDAAAIAFGISTPFRCHR